MRPRLAQDDRPLGLPNDKTWKEHLIRRGIATLLGTKFQLDRSGGLERLKLIV